MNYGNTHVLSEVKFVTKQWPREEASRVPPPVLHPIGLVRPTPGPRVGLLPRRPSPPPPGPHPPPPRRPGGRGGDPGGAFLRQRRVGETRVFLPRMHRTGKKATHCCARHPATTLSNPSLTLRRKPRALLLVLLPTLSLHSLPPSSPPSPRSVSTHLSACIFGRR